MNNTIKPSLYYGLAIICFIAGLGYYAWQRGWLIIQCPTHNILATSLQTPSDKKTVTLYAWHANQWKKEKTELILPDQQAGSAQIIIQALLAWFADERWLGKKVTIDHILTSNTDQELLVSLNKVLFSKTMSTHHKIAIIESIMKTLRENGIKIPLIRFLVDHEPMHDTHLDFTHSWPLEGYSH